MAPALGLQLHRPAHRLDGVEKRETRHFDLRPAGIQAAEGQQILNNPGHAVRLADNDVQEIVLHILRNIIRIPDRLGVAADVGKGRAELMGDVCHELFAHLLIFSLGGNVVHHRHGAAALPVGHGGQVQLQNPLAHRQLPGSEVGPLQPHHPPQGQLLSEEGVVIVEGNLPAQHLTGGGIAGENSAVVGEGNDAVGHVEKERIQLIALAGHLLQGVLQDSCHIVEGGGQNADLIGGLHSNGRAEVPRRHPLRPLGQPLDGDNHGLAEEEGEQHGDQQAHQQGLDDDQEKLAVEGVDGIPVVVDINNVGVLAAVDGDGHVHIAGSDVALRAHAVRAGGDAGPGGQKVRRGLQALEPLLAVAAGQERAGAAIEDIVIPGVGVQSQVAGPGSDHVFDHLVAVGLGRLPAEGVNVGGVGGIGAAEHSVHLVVELVDIKAGNAGHHEGSHHRHQGGDEQEHN